MYTYYPGWIFFVLIILLPVPTSANQGTIEASKPFEEIRILIDISGSMKLSDPKNLRTDALKLFISLLPTDSRAGVWTFGQWVNMLIKPNQVNDQWKESARRLTSEINSHGMYTNLEGVIEDSTWDWTHPDPSYHRNVILLTDGFVDISQNQEENAASRRRILEKLIPRLNLAGIKVNTIGLSQHADTKLLQQIATGTGGWYETIDSADNLEKLFFRMFEKVSASDSIPITNNIVSIDGHIKEATFLIFRNSDEEKTSITTPSDILFTQEQPPKFVSWHSESHYDLITVTNPEPGNWKINAKLDPDNRVMVVTDLKLVATSLPNDLAEKRPITFQVHLNQEGKIISRREFLRFVKISLTQTSIKDQKWQWQLFDDGKFPDVTANDGIYSTVISESLIDGEHEFAIDADGTTFKRNSRQLVKIHKYPISISTTEQQNGQFLLSLIPYQSLIDTNSIKFDVVHIYPSGKSQNLTISRTGPTEWRSILDAHNFPGKHSIAVHVTGISPDGMPIDLSLSSIDFTTNALNDGAKNTEIKENTANIADSNDQKADWLFVSLRLIVLNIFLIAFTIAGLKLWPIIRPKLIPDPSEDFIHVNN